jgi:uncharacterized protein
MKNSKPVYLTLILIIILILIAFLITYNTPQPSTPQACINGKCYKLEIAKSYNERTRGLMYRQSLSEETGMLFIFPSSSKHSFWMKNTLIPLDIIWISSKNIIVHINHNTPPCKNDPCPSYSPSEEALFVLEINANQAKINNLNEGDKVNLNYIN